MPSVKFFFKNDCPNCPKAKHTVEQLLKSGYEIEEYNLDTPDGLAEAAFYSVMSTPTILIVNNDDLIIKEFRSSVPALNEMVGIISQYSTPNTNVSAKK